MKLPFVEMGKSVGGTDLEGSGERSAAHFLHIRLPRGDIKDAVRYTNLKFKAVG